MGIFEYLNNKKSGDFKSKKENNTVETIKRMVALGLLTASIATAGLSSTACEKTPEVPYEQMVSQVAEKLDEAREDLDYNYVLSVKDEKTAKCYWIFIEQISGKTIAYNITEEQFKQFGKIAKSSKDIGYDKTTGIVVMPASAVLDGNIKSKANELIYSIVENGEPFEYDDQKFMAIGDFSDTSIKTEFTSYAEMYREFLSDTKDGFDTTFTLDEIKIGKVVDATETRREGNAVYMGTPAKYGMLLIDNYSTDGGENNRVQSIPFACRGAVYDNLKNALAEIGENQYIRKVDEDYYIDAKIFDDNSMESICSLLLDNLKQSACLTDNAIDMPLEAESEMTK